MQAVHSGCNNNVAGRYYYKNTAFANISESQSQQHRKCVAAAERHVPCQINTYTPVDGGKRSKESFMRLP